MNVDTRERRGETVLTLHGSFNPHDLEELRSLLATLGEAARVTIDFHDVGSAHDVAVAKLASELDDVRLSIVGLSDHHRRLLRYMGASQSRL
jgi:hypothetical protein